MDMNNKVIIGPIDINKPAVDESMYCSAQLIKKKGKKLPITPTKTKKKKSF